MRGVVAPLARSTAFGGLILALALAPALFRGGVAEAKKSHAQCTAEFRTCSKSCDSITNTNPQRGPTKTSCALRCNYAASRCYGGCPEDRPPTEANCPGSTKAPSKTTRPPQTAPLEPLTQTKGTRSPGTVPRHPLTPDNVTRSPTRVPTNSPLTPTQTPTLRQR